MTGTILLILLGAGVLVTGRIINGMAVQMSERVITQISQYHYRLLQAEFGRSEEVLTVAAQFMRTHPAASETELQVLASTLTEMDPKVGRIWFMEESRHILRSYARGGELQVSAAGEELRRQAARMQDDSVRSRVNEQVWSMSCRVRDSRGKGHICGIDLPLQAIYDHMAEQNPHSRSYAILLDPEGMTVYHPNPQILGHPASESTASEAFREVLATGRQTITYAVSEYLGVEEDRISYPLQLGGRRWVAGIGIPRLAIEQDIDDFHFYTILTAVISVLFFATLLIVAQRRWRREYDLRRLSEQESAQLHLQQVLEQIDPHFLFNSLNSLYALIRCNPEQAREFTLTLSKVYRHVLERRKQILSTLSDEIDFTWQYYSLQKIRFGDRIELTTAIDPALRNWRIPAMSLQTLVENALKHNRITGRNPLHIRIRTEGESLLIENNFTPRSEGNTESLGVGLERIRSVYRFYTEENISISSDAESFRCRLPLLPPEKQN